VSQTLGGLAVLAVLLRGRAGLALRVRFLRPRPDLLRRLLRVSVPAAADSLSMQLGYLWFVAIVNGLGDVAAAAHGIALIWEALAYQPGSAFGTAAISLVGQHLGAGQPRRAARSGWVAFAFGAGLMSFMGVLFFALAAPMFRLFCPHPGQEPIVAAGVPVLRLIAFAMPPLACTIIFTAALRGAGATAGERVAIVMEPGVDQVPAVLGALLAGAVLAAPACPYCSPGWVSSACASR
jgi:Na+-driven multidrug efflux pump